MPPERERPRSGEALLRDERLSRREDYQRCYQKGRRNYASHLTLYFVENGGRRARLGMTVSRKVGGAVVRARIKRRFREIYRRWPQRKDLPPLDLVVHAKPSARSATFGELREDLVTGLQRVVAKHASASPRAQR